MYTKKKKRGNEKKKVVGREGRLNSFEKKKVLSIRKEKENKNKQKKRAKAYHIVRGHGPKGVGSQAMRSRETQINPKYKAPTYCRLRVAMSMTKR